MATEAGQDEEPVAGTSFSQPMENVDMHLTMAEQMHQMQQMMGAIMNKFQKWEAEHDQTVAAESENESVGDSPARCELNKALELTVNSARGEKSRSGEVDTATDSELCVVIPQTKESGLKASASQRALTRANQTLASLGDAISTLGMAQQEISLRRNLLIQSALPKDIVSICQKEDLPVKDKLFSGDVEKAIRSAREAHKHSNKSTPSTSGQRHHPYKRQHWITLS